MYKKSLYHCALNGQGYVLYGAPRVGLKVFSQKSAPVFSNRFASGDRSYLDFSLWWYWAQTDWSGGFQDEKWVDKATSKIMLNLDPLSRYGYLSLEKATTSIYNFTPNATQTDIKAFELYNQKIYLGTYGTSNVAHFLSINSSDTVTHITTNWTAINAVNDLCVHKDKLYLALSRSSGSEYTLQTYNGSTFGNVRNARSTVRMVCSVNERLWISEYVSSSSGDALLYSDDNGATFTELISSTGKNRFITKGIDNLGLFYFLIEDTPRLELWRIDDTYRIRIYTWDYLVEPQIYSYNGFVFISGRDENNKLRIYEWNGSVLKESFEQQLTPPVIPTIPNSNFSKRYFVEHQGKLYTQGLVYDGEIWSSAMFKYDTTNKIPFISFGSSEGAYLYFFYLKGGKIYIDRTTASTYETSGYVITGTFDANSPAIDKLWREVELNFDKLSTGQSFEVLYSTDDEATWNSLGTCSYEVQGAVDNWIFPFPDNVLSKSIQLKIVLNGNGSSTPILHDWSVKYLPQPDYRFQFNLLLNCSEKILLADKKTYEPKSGSELRAKLINDWLSKNVVLFESIDYCETKLNGSITKSATTIPVVSTADFPEQGRIRIDDEEIKYTGKTATSFTGCIRGWRGTKATSHSNGVLVHNGYKVIIENCSIYSPLITDAKSDEYIVQLTLFEV